VLRLVFETALAIPSKSKIAVHQVKNFEWCLLTNHTAPFLEDVIELIGWYWARWNIESVP